MDKLNDILNIAPVDSTENKEIITSTQQDIIPQDHDQVKDDFEYARKNLYDVIEASQDAMQDMLDVARQSQHPRAYEVLNSMLKNIADVSKDLVDLQKKKMEIIKPVAKNEDTPQQVNNNLFVGSTAELQKMLDDMKKGD